MKKQVFMILFLLSNYYYSFSLKAKFLLASASQMLAWSIRASCRTGSKDTNRPSLGKPKEKKRKEKEKAKCLAETLLPI